MVRTQHEPKLTARMQRAIDELKALLSEHYPEATFRVSHSPDDRRGIDLVTTVDLEDRDEVMDLVIDRLLELQIKDRLPVHVIPVRTRERNLAIIRQQIAEEQRLASAQTTP